MLYGNLPSFEEICPLLDEFLRTGISSEYQRKKTNSLFEYFYCNFSWVVVVLIWMFQTKSFLESPFCNVLIIIGDTLILCHLIFPILMKDTGCFKQFSHK